jgi:hypothetical protein
MDDAELQMQVDQVDDDAAEELAMRTTRPTLLRSVPADAAAAAAAATGEVPLPARRRRRPQLRLVK